MFNASEKAKQNTYNKIQEQRILRRKELIRRLSEKAKSDPNGIWNELLLEANTPIIEEYFS
jgi:hypothetical protein